MSSTLRRKQFSKKEKKRNIRYSTKKAGSKTHTISNKSKSIQSLFFKPNKTTPHSNIDARGVTNLSSRTSPSKTPLILRLRAPVEEIVRIKNDFLLNYILSNYQYISFEFHDFNCQTILSRVFGNLREINQKTQSAGSVSCNGDLLLSDNTELKSHFYNLGRLKYHMDRIHDFKGNDKLKNETDIFDNYVTLLSYLNENVESEEYYNFKELFNTSFREYNVKDGLTGDKREHFYFMQVLNFMVNECGLTNSLFITKYSSDKTVLDEVDDDLKFVFAGNTTQEQDTEDDNSKEYFISTIEGSKITPQFSENNIDYAFKDNNIVPKVLYPVSLLESATQGPLIEGKNIISKSDYDSFQNKFKKGEINTIASFLDPATTSKDFVTTKVYDIFDLNRDIDNQDINSDIDTIKTRIQETQKLDSPLCYYAVKLLSKGYNDYFNYFGALLRVDFDNITNSEAKERECIKYLKEGLYDSSVLPDDFEYPIRYFRNPNSQKDNVIGIEVDVVMFKGSQQSKHVMKFNVGDTTIKNIQQHINGLKQNKNLENIANIIYESMPDSIQGISIQNEQSRTAFKKIKEIIILTLKAYGDSLQINYAKRLNNFLKINDILLENIGIRSTDKNVLAECLLLDLPIWCTNNGLNTNKHWLQDQKIIDSNDKTIGIKMFLTNYKIDNDRLYYVNLMKTTKKLLNILQNDRQSGGSKIDCSKKKIWEVDFNIEEFIISETSTDGLEILNNMIQKINEKENIEKYDYIMSTDGKLYKILDAKRGKIEIPSKRTCKESKDPDVSNENKKEVTPDEDKGKEGDGSSGEIIDASDENDQDEVDINSGEEKNGSTEEKNGSAEEKSGSVEEIDEVETEYSDESDKEEDVELTIAEIIIEHDNPESEISIDQETIDKIFNIILKVLKYKKNDQILTDEGYQGLNDIRNIESNQDKMRDLDIFLKNIIDIYENLTGDLTLINKIEKYNSDVENVIDELCKDYLSYDKIGTLTIVVANELERKITEIEPDYKIIGIFNGMDKTKKYVNLQLQRLIEESKEKYQDVCNILLNNVKSKLTNIIKIYIIKRTKLDYYNDISDMYNRISFDNKGRSQKRFETIYITLYEKYLDYVDSKENNLTYEEIDNLIPNPDTLPNIRVKDDRTKFQIALDKIKQHLRSGIEEIENEYGATITRGVESADINQISNIEDVSELTGRRLGNKGGRRKKKLKKTRKKQGKNKEKTRKKQGKKTRKKNKY
tara:strand:- start:4741 stop:8430 length:3690 start_codon:yes stop_codon:yes gene_type:complete